MHALTTKLAASWPPAEWQDISVVLAVSGGADSVALLRAIQELRASTAGRLLVGHFNHGTRGTESDDDQRFVEQLCDQLNMNCETGRPDDRRAVTSDGDGFEAAARAARYEFLQDLAERHGARYVVTAHTSDDQVETIVHRILRGTGLNGLRGIPRARELSAAVSLLRPMLEVTRAEVLDYLNDIGQPFREDASNRDTDVTRNRIRHELLPGLREDFNPAVDEALIRLGQLATESQQAIEAMVAPLYERSVTRSGTAVVIDCRALAAVPPYVVQALLMQVWQSLQWPLQSMGREQWQTLAELLSADRDVTRILPGQVHAQKKDEQLMLTRPL